MFLSRQLLSLACASILLVAAGCSSMSGGGSSTMSSPTKAVVTTGQGTTTVYVPAGDSVTMLASDGAKKCPTCEADAAAYFKTGKLDPKCPVCGASRTALSGVN